jgi:arsenate reductase (thioredoxin)
MEKLKRVLFVCIGNACRSQMAEAFARAYGNDVIVPASAGISPGIDIHPATLRAMEEKNLDLRDHFPKSLRQVSRMQFDVVVNMTGDRFRAAATSVPGARMIEWDIPDPVSMSYQDHCDIRDMIERKVMNLILELRQERKKSAGQLV